MTSTPIELSFKSWTIEQDSSCQETSDSPLLLLIHGLDSTLSTWDGVAVDHLLKYFKEGFEGQSPLTSGLTIVAVDLRCHGESACGDWQTAFSLDNARQIVSDIRHTLQKNFTYSSLFLVGHSAGGRIAMKYAANFAEKVDFVAIEDMDIKARARPPSLTSKLAAFKRDFDTCESAVQSLISFGYQEERVRAWIGSRIYPKVLEQNDAEVWHTGISPLAQYLVREYVLSRSGKADFLSMTSPHGRPAPQVIVFVASRGSACSKDSLMEMMDIHPVELYEAQDAGHSIHREAPDWFASTLVRSVLKTIGKQNDQ